MQAQAAERVDRRAAGGSGPLMRASIHLVTAVNFLALRPVVRPVLERGFRSRTPFGRKLDGVDRPSNPPRPCQAVSSVSRRRPRHPGRIRASDSSAPVALGGAARSALGTGPLGRPGWRRSDTDRWEPPVRIAGWPWAASGLRGDQVVAPESLVDSGDGRRVDAGSPQLGPDPPSPLPGVVLAHPTDHHLKVHVDLGRGPEGWRDRDSRPSGPWSHTAGGAGRRSALRSLAGGTPRPRSRRCAPAPRGPQA
jgi:hypothetical protein